MDAAPWILLFDDEPLVRDTIARMLTLRGFVVITGQDGRDGLRQVSEPGYDVLVTDLFMPDVDGIELLRAARKSRPGIPIVCMSGGSPRLPNDFGLTLLNGFNVRIITKPFCGKTLADAVHAALAAQPQATRSLS